MGPSLTPGANLEGRVFDALMDSKAGDRATLPKTDSWGILARRQIKKHEDAGGFFKHDRQTHRGRIPELRIAGCGAG